MSKVVVSGTRAAQCLMCGLHVVVVDIMVLWPLLSPLTRYCGSLVSSIGHLHWVQSAKGVAHQ